jgi:hypothetical protein
MPQAMLTGGTNNFNNQWWYPDLFTGRNTA